LSIIITMGFERQLNIESPELGDEFDHMYPLRDATAPVELIVVDRSWPKRWLLLKQAFEGSGIRLKYIPSKPSMLLSRGYRAVNAMRNSGAIASEGCILAFVDDFFWLDASSADAVWEAWKKHRFILCPVVGQRLWPPEGHIGYQVFSGHNPGIYMCTREQFIALGGFNEHFDGAHGEADTEWQHRLDRICDTTPGWTLRRRLRGVMWKRTEHANGDCPQKLLYPWSEQHPGVTTRTNSLRCNRAFYQKISVPRIAKSIFDASIPLTQDEVERLRGYRCVAHCGVCSREDRDMQIDSYMKWPIDEDVSRKMVDGAAYKREGIYDPWVVDDG